MMASRGEVSASGQSAKIPAPPGTSPNDQDQPFSADTANVSSRQKPSLELIEVDDRQRALFSAVQPEPWLTWNLPFVREGRRFAVSKADPLQESAQSTTIDETASQISTWSSPDRMLA